MNLISRLPSGPAAGRWISILTVAAGALFGPRAARACSTQAPPPALETLPADGAVEVPTDVRPTVNAFAAGIYSLTDQAPTFELVDPAGHVVALTPGDGFTWDLELSPAEALTPNTRYQLNGHWAVGAAMTPVDKSVSFTTGAGPLAAAPPRPQASMEHYFFSNGPGSSCDPQPTGSCVAMPDDAVVELTFVDTFKQELGSGYSKDGEHPIPYLMRGPFFINLSGRDQGTNFLCAKLRTRAANGAVSDALTLCGSDAPTFSVRSTKIACTAGGLTVDGQLAPMSPATKSVPTVSIGGGCAVAGGAPGSAGLAFGLAALVFATTRRARRSNRR
jgi:MYXO-CTERM domain-containing protein